ncbi:MAG: hypothetical protein K6G88_13495 [Lachnospiraceae bacterium]|nr:hypothetical protein [Lachnospiraceae bacterium]
MSNTNPGNKLSLNTLLIILATVIFVGGAIGVKMLSSHKKDSGSSAVNQNAATAATKNIPDATKGDIEATIDSVITFRDVTFDMSIDDVKALEDKNEDTLANPAISKSGDGYTYIYYLSNPEKPLNYNKINVGSENAPGLTYVFNNDSLEEVRLQFGLIDEATFNSIIGNLKGSYGESTFYRSTNGTESYWWKSDKQLFMLTRDSYSTTLFYRRN